MATIVHIAMPNLINITKLPNFIDNFVLNKYNKKVNINPKSSRNVWANTTTKNQIL